VPLARELEALPPLVHVCTGCNHLTGDCTFRTLLADTVQALTSSPQQLASLHCQYLSQHGLEAATGVAHCSHKLVHDGELATEEVEQANGHELVLGLDCHLEALLGRLLQLARRRLKPGKCLDHDCGWTATRPVHWTEPNDVSVPLEKSSEIPERESAIKIGLKQREKETIDRGY